MVLAIRIVGNPRRTLAEGRKVKLNADFGYLSPNNTSLIFRAMPIELVCLTLRLAAIEDRATALLLLTVSKAIHNIVLPILYDTVHLTTDRAAEKFAMAPMHPRRPIAGCRRPVVRYLNTTKVDVNTRWRQLADGRPEIAHLCVSLADLHPMSLMDRQLQPLHVGVAVDETHEFPDYAFPLPNPLLRRVSISQEAPGSVNPWGGADGGFAQSHGTLFMRATHVYFLDNIPPTKHLECLRTYLTRVTHIAFPYRRELGTQREALRTVLRAALQRPSVLLVLVVRMNWSEDVQEDWEELSTQFVREMVDPRVVLIDDSTLAMKGLTWDEDEESIWRLAEETRRKVAEEPWAKQFERLISWNI
ncbi:hypothetical protein DFH06DRAFT_731665 [Mycena polygramma]|nr:hypothetical protein DFH06DRAFT_731665 [Mycena polygramma]